MSEEVANLLAKKFIARTDVKAYQYGDGIWGVHTLSGKADGERIKWRKQDLLKHLRGEKTFGHYLLNENSLCKLIAFDIDLEKTGSLPETEFFASDEPRFYEEADLRTAWLNRAHPARSFMKYQFRLLAGKIMTACYDVLGNPQMALAYSGSKGVHVYAFMPKPILGAEAREGAEIVLETTDIKLVRGKNFFKHPGFNNLSIELYPKQDALDGSREQLGNLMRMPLGRNHKAPGEPTFFIDPTSPLAELAPLDPIKALTRKNPWETNV